MIDVDKLAAIDTETSGVDPFRHQLMALSIIPLASLGPGCDVPGLKVFVGHNDIEWTEVALQYYDKYKNEWDRHAVGVQEAYKIVRDYCESFLQKDTLLIGHNVGFDYSFLKKLAFQAGGATFPNLSHRLVDTHSLLRALYWRGDIPENACNSTGAFEHFGISIPEEKRHTAEGDAIGTIELLNKILEIL